MSLQSSIETSNQLGTTPAQAMLDVQLHETGPGELTVQLAGELDIAGGELVKAVLESHECPRMLRVDLAALTFIDCAGLRTLEEVRDRVQAKDSAGVLVLVRVGARIRRLLRMTRLDRVLPTDASFALGSDGCISLSS
jgi:anti-anti-sigma factor